MDSIDKETHDIEHDNPWTEQITLPASEFDEKQAETNLAPVDRGVKAWSILAGAFLFEALIWGKR